MGQLRNFRKDETPFQNLLLLQPLLNADGEVHLWLGVQFDVTDGTCGGQALTPALLQVRVAHASHQYVYHTTCVESGLVLARAAVQLVVFVCAACSRMRAVLQTMGLGFALQSLPSHGTARSTCGISDSDLPFLPRR